LLKEMLKKKDFRYIVMYGVIGGIAAVIDFSAFAFCVKVLFIHNVVANLISMHLGMLFSFTCNTFFNFKKTDKFLRRFLSYYIIVLIGMGISSIMVGILSIHFPVLIVKLIAIIIVSIIQYMLNRFVTYRF